MEKSTIIDISLEVINKIFRDIKYNDKSKMSLIYDLEFERLLNYLNRDNLPNQLIYTLAFRIAGHILRSETIFTENKALANLDVLKNVIELKEYETTIKYTNKNDRYDIYIDNLYNYGKGELTRWRLVIWK